MRSFHFGLSFSSDEYHCICIIDIDCHTTSTPPYSTTLRFIDDFIGRKIMSISKKKTTKKFLPAAPGSCSSLAKAESLGNFTVVWVVGRGRRSIDDIWMEVTQYTKSSTAMMQTSFQFPTFHCFLWYVNSPPHHQTFPRPSYIFSTSFCWVMMLPFIDS